MKRQLYKFPTSQIDNQEIYEGISIEEKLRKATTTNEPIENVIPEIYTERKDGVLPQYDIRTDRFDIALDAQNKIEASRAAQRDNKPTETKQEQPTGKEE